MGQKRKLNKLLSKRKREESLREKKKGGKRPKGSISHKQKRKKVANRPVSKKIYKTRSHKKVTTGTGGYCNNRKRQNKQTNGEKLPKKSRKGKKTTKLKSIAAVLI